jgi:hypothetical protein
VRDLDGDEPFELRLTCQQYAPDGSRAKLANDLEFRLQIGQFVSAGLAYPLDSRSG